MNLTKTTFILLLLLTGISMSAQLGFCPGSKGEPLFTENFGNGTTYGPALPAGTTTYPFVTGAPNDGQYTLFYHSNMYSTWHYSLDHTPDATNGANGKMLLMNANATQTGDFYKKTVTGLCVNTTFEFSAWVMNVYNPNTNYCGAGQIPINVRFEIWNAAETVLLGSGNTGNIMGSPAPLWQQFALVFTTVNETTVVLKMKNNGLGGCGNDLAIDDISFSACGDLTTVSSPSAAGDTFTTCSSPASIQLNAATAGGITYFYQWQTSTDGTTWTDISGATNATYTTPNLTAQTFYRVKAAQDAANLNGTFCSALSNVFTVSFLGVPNAAVSNGDQTICSDEAIPALSVTADAGTGVNWYSAASGGTLLLANTTSYTPASAGIYYAETFTTTSNCTGPRIPVGLTIIPLPDVTISGTTSVCSGNTATINFNGTPNAVVTYTVNSGTNQTITLNASGVASITTAALAASVTYTLVNVTSSELNTCVRPKSQSATITVNTSPVASVSTNAPVCAGSSATVTFTGTPNATVTYTVNSGANQTSVLDASGSATVTIPNVTSTLTYTLVNVSGTGGCSQTLSQSIAVSSVQMPTASVSVNPAIICANQTSTVTFSGTPDAVIIYKVNAGADQSITLNSAGNASLSASGLSADTTYTLVSATSGVLNSCVSNLSGSATITVNALPTASISSNSPVCNGSPAVVTFTGTPNATVSYSVNSTAQTILLNAAGTASIAIPSVTSSVVYTLVGVTAAAPNGCTKALTQAITVSSVALPTASITSNPGTVCAGQTSQITFSGSPNASVTYTVNGGVNQMITLDGSGSALLTTSALAANQTYQLVHVAAGSGCSQAVSGATTVSVNPTPDALFSGDLVYCEGESLAISLSSNFAGTSFNWTVTQNGLSGAADGSGNLITQTLALTGNVAGTATYTVTPILNGCTGTPVNISITVYPLPVPQIADGVICTLGSAPTSSQFYTLDTNLSAADHTFQWFFAGNPIPGASASTYNATQIGTYTVIATNGAGCASVPIDAVVGQMAQGESLEVEHSPAFSENPGISVTVMGGGGPFLYQLDDLPFQTSNIFTNVSAGTHLIRVVDGNCTDLSTSVTIIDYPKYFTPNGDGFHDTWNIGSVGTAQIAIFDRYGKLIKQISPDGLGWDGTYNGRELPSTDYWFTIDYSENGKNKTFKAHFSLKR